LAEQHPITPPPELIDEWHKAWIDAKVKHFNLVEFLAIQGAQWGADQELEACIEWTRSDSSEYDASALRDARRQKLPPETIEVDGFTYRLEK